MSGFAEDVRRDMAAATHYRAHPRVKVMAARLQLTPRTVQRWRAKEYAAGSPVHRHDRVIEAADAPFELVAHAYATAVQASVREVPTADLLIRYRELERADALHEGRDNALKGDPTVGWMPRAESAEQDAAHDLERAAIARELAARRVAPEGLYHNN